MRLVGIILAAAAVGPQEGFKQENKPENLKALFERIHKANGEGDARGADALARPLFPDFDRARRGLRPDLPKDAVEPLAEYFRQFTRIPDGQAGRAFRAEKSQTQVNVHGALTEEIISYAKGSTAFQEFPGGSRRVAETVLKPGVTFYEVEFVEPGKNEGMKYHLFFWDGERWTMLGPLWRVPSAEEFAKRREEQARHCVLLVGSAARRLMKRAGKLPDGSAADLVKALTSGPEPLLDPNQLRTNAKGDPTDPWDRPLVYKPGRPECFLYGLGPDGKDEGGAGDDLGWNRLHTELVLKWGTKALEIHKSSHDAFPETDGFAAMVKKHLDPTSTSSPPPPDSVTERGELIDGWESPLVYRKTESGFELRSCGPNRKDDRGQGDDLRP